MMPVCGVIREKSEVIGERPALSKPSIRGERAGAKY
jgi:hypothetical protein